MVSRRQESPQTLSNTVSASPDSSLSSPATTTTTAILVPETPQQSIQALINDPPPPYPLPGQRSRIRGTNNRSLNAENRVTSNRILTRNHQLSDDEETPLLGRETRRTRRRSISHGSIISAVSAAPSLAQTVASLFQAEYDSDYEADGDDEGGEDEEAHRDGAGQRNAPGHGRRVPSEDTVTFSSDDEHHHQPTRTHEGRQYTQLPHFNVQDHQEEEQQRTWRHRRTAFSLPFWKRYYKPLFRKRYWQSFFHLAVVNFPFGLVAWLYLFVFTLTGTALLITLPIGAILCFLNAFGARTFARGELYLQTELHRSSTTLPYHPNQYTLFTRLRPPTSAEIENGLAVTGEMIPEQSFYRNSYAMFADPTTYQSLFYFLVIKPPITLTLFVLSLGVFLPMLVLAPLTGPLALRAARRLGRWQAGVAVDGLLSRRV